MFLQPPGSYVDANRGTTSVVTSLLNDYANMMKQKHLVTGKNTGAPTYAVEAASQLSQQESQELADERIAQEELRKYVDIRDSTYILDETPERLKRLEEIEGSTPRTLSEDRNDHAFQPCTPGELFEQWMPQQPETAFGHHSENDTIGSGMIDELSSLGKSCLLYTSDAADDS